LVRREATITFLPVSALALDIFIHPKKNIREILNEQFLKVLVYDTYQGPIE
jgi:hypothetical protein